MLHSLAVGWMNLGLAYARRTLNSIFFPGGGITVWGCFSGFQLGPSVPLNSNVNSTACKDIFNNYMLCTLWQQFVSRKTVHLSTR